MVDLGRDVAFSSWFLAALGTLLLWGVWGVALKIASTGEEWYRVYVTTNLVIVAAVVALLVYYSPANAIMTGSKALVALLAGASGTLGYFFLILALKWGGKASIVIPLTSLYPAVTVVLSRLVLGEEATLRQYVGIALAIIAILLMTLES